jgi:hypothetical protein
MADFCQQFALLTEYICDRFRSIKFKGKSLMLLTATLLWSVRPLVSIFPIMDTAWQTALSVGGMLIISFSLLYRRVGDVDVITHIDFHWGGYQINWIIHTRILQGVPIMPLLARIPKYLEWCIKVKHDLVIRMLQAAQLILFNLIGATADELTFTVPGPAHTTPTQAVTHNQLTEVIAGTTASNLATSSSPAITTTLPSAGVVSGSDGTATTSSPTVAASSAAASAAAAAGSSMSSTAPRRQSRAEQRLVGLSPMSITEEEFISAVETSQLNVCLVIYLVWKSRVLYLYGHLDRAWVTIQRATSLRHFMPQLSPECELVFCTALILLAKIGRILVCITPSCL